MVEEEFLQVVEKLRKMKKNVARHGMQPSPQDFGIPTAWQNPGLYGGVDVKGARLRGQAYGIIVDNYLINKRIYDKSSGKLLFTAAVEVHKTLEATRHMLESIGGAIKGHVLDSIETAKIYWTCERLKRDVSHVATSYIDGVVGTGDGAQDWAFSLCDRLNLDTGSLFALTFAGFSRDMGLGAGILMTGMTNARGGAKTGPKKNFMHPRVKPINNRQPINAEFAGQVYPLEKLPVELRQKYPHSVPFTGTGHPDFSRYAEKKVKIKMTGQDSDFRLADKAAGFSKRPSGYVWHHHHDGESMYLVPQDIHDAVRHTGGVAITKGKK